MLNRKKQIEEHKKTAREKLAARLQRLKSDGLDDKQMLKDTQVKHLKALIRQANNQMNGIAAMERLNIEKAQAKASKTAAARESSDKPKKAQKSEAPKKAKKEKKPVAAEE